MYKYSQHSNLTATLLVVTTEMHIDMPHTEFIVTPH
jgi:hypothetical protein